MLCVSGPCSKKLSSACPISSFQSQFRNCNPIKESKEEVPAKEIDEILDQETDSI